MFVVAFEVLRFADFFDFPGEACGTLGIFKVGCLLVLSCGKLICFADGTVLVVCWFLDCSGAFSSFLA